ncbi:MAG: MFS transporter [Smithella sp.]|jgi:MFS family permease
MSLKSTFRALQYKNYRLFFIGQGLSLIGTWMQRIATSWLVYRLTNSVVLLGITGFAGQIPTFFLSPFGGIIADRWNRKNILLVTQILALLQALLLAVLVLTNAINVYLIIILNVCLGVINAFDITARQSFVVEMIEDKKDLGNAIALNSSMVNGARLVGPSITGILIAFAGEGVCFLINALSYVVIIVALLAMKIVPREKILKKTNVISDFREGFVYVCKSVPMRSTIVLLALVSLMGVPYQVLMPVFAKQILGGGPHTFGFLMGATGLGALTGAMYLASRKNVHKIWKMIPVSAVVFGIGLITFSLSKNLWISLALLLIVGWGMMVQMASSNTLLQVLVDDDKRGRIMAFYAMAFMGMVPFGSLIAGSLGKIIGVRGTVFLGGVLCILGAFYFSGDIHSARDIMTTGGKKITPIMEEGIESSKEVSDSL